MGDQALTVHEQRLLVFRRALRTRHVHWDRVIAVGLIIPSALAIGIFVYAFIAWTIYVSLSAWGGPQPDLTFVGLKNYARLFVEPGIDSTRFLFDLRNMAGFTLMFVAACLLIGMLLAALLDRHIKGENLFRSIFLFPMAISFVVTGVSWQWLLTPSFGDQVTGLNLLFEYLHLDFLKSLWFTNPTVYHIPPDSAVGRLLVSIGLGGLASPYVGVTMGVISLVIAATWQLSGYCMALYLAGLRTIPDELREAARIDGASEWQVYRYIVLPLLRPITLSAIIILGHISLKIYDLVVAMTGPGPGFSSDMPAFNMWETTFDATLFNQGAAIAVVLLIMVATLIIPYLYYSIRSEAQV